MMTSVTQSYKTVLQIEYGKVDEPHGKIDRRKIFNEFCDASTIHGLKYLGTRPLYEKILWIVFFTISLTACGYQIKATWSKWDNNPVIVTFNENFVSITQIPFPAVTICKQIKVQRSLFDYDPIYTNVLRDGLNALENNYSVDAIKAFELMAQTCIKDGSRKDMMKIVGEFANHESLLDQKLLEKLAPDFSETFLQCGGMMTPDHWKCSEVLSMILTEDGVCHTFNLLPKDEMLNEGTALRIVDRTEKIKPNWSLEVSKPMDSDEYEYGLTFCKDPLRAYTVGQKLSIKVASNSSDVSRYCQGTGERYKIFLHNPYEIPSNQHQSYDMDIDQIVTLSVRPRVVLASENIKTAYTAKQRRCYFNSEKKLRYFRIYSKRNCEIECLANITVAKCGCTPFWLPREKDACKPICGLKDYHCMTKTSYRLFNIEIAVASFTHESPDPSQIKNSKEQAVFGCNCMAACKTVMYEADIRAVKLVENHSGILLASKEISNDSDAENTDVTVNDVKFSKLIVQFKEAEFIAMKRSELYGLTDFIANCGGILGLFMGVSILSFVEVIYFFCVRCFSTTQCRRRGHRN
uniref:CSON000424 protein n=1 Tax=Culicoides sonorensis TaxID=179676 RepID=A0A336MEN0_CULSO